MFGRKKKIESLRKQKKEQAKRYAHVVESAVKIYSRDIEEAKKKKSKGVGFHEDRLDCFLRTVRETTEYQENKKKYDKIIERAKMQAKPEAKRK